MKSWICAVCNSTMTGKACVICASRKLIAKQAKRKAKKAKTPVEKKSAITRLQTIAKRALKLPVVQAENADFTIQRPRTRGDCLSGGCNEQRPCPWVSCRFNNYLDVSRRGVLQISDPRLEPHEVDPRYSCALDVAERGGLVLERVGELLGLTRERIRQIERHAFSVLAKDSAMKVYANSDDMLDEDTEWDVSEDLD